jgi:predicted component of type VI protein secretion system
MQDLIKKLNAIDIGKLFSGKGVAADTSANAETSRVSIMDELLFRIDKKLAVIVVSALFLIFVGLSSMFRTIEAFNTVSDLEVKVSLLEAEKQKIEAEIGSTKKVNQELFLLAKNAVSNQEELLKVLTDAYSNAGMSILKVVTGTADKPDLIQINAEGSYRSVQYLLSELRLLSPSIDVKLLQIGTDPTKDMLQMSLGLRFVKAPKFSQNALLEQEKYAYMDGSKVPSAFARSTFKTVQFVPQVPVAQIAPPVNSAASSAGAQSATTKAQSSKDLALERNPFYIPPSQSTGAPALPVSPSANFSGVPTPSGSSARSDGIYATGCIVSPSKKACLFQLMDGSSVIYSVGAAIQKDVKILDIFTDSVKVSTPNGPKIIKVGEQVK